jgi:hypothetical protein
LLVCGLCVHANATSLHKPYAERLNRAFIVKVNRFFRF